MDNVNEKENWMGELFIYNKAFLFAKRIIKLYKYLTIEKKEYVLSKQLLRSGTSIGANIKEAKYAESDSDFTHKLKVSLKEANESEYWIRLLEEEYLSSKEVESLLMDLDEIIGLLVTSINKIRSRKASKE